MQKILFITEKPNDAASKLKIENFFDIDKNPFCQFFGRLIFGSEELYIKCFNIENILWMHAKGSSAYDSKDDDGKEAIIKKVNSDNFKLIITFGKPAMNIILPEEKMENIFSLNKGYPLKKKDLTENISKKINVNNETGFCFFPHPSGQAQHLWIKNAAFLSKNLNRTQALVVKTIVK